ncbi:two component transcriptional regulator, winged helix family [Oscillochloris trichoides DG-6]|uniref:Two component transcriptional regulator, winged helix family n=1 Tax=Oscillochloris trichoides DG-6 TaxID=765420 RepID=E1IB49_9CHLR|nr:response regulator transcription factor [Oscillochloris trichoides]EFO81534.1 two component transcriptional regulator, winged helix family [Oscillochloris trichoides DG-6]
MQTILVTDDDRQIVRLVSSYLEQAGYRVLTAYDGEATLRLARTERPDLLVLDLMLPDRDGYSIVQTLRGDPHLGGMPIIMLTARVEDTDRIVGLELGADDYIGKPFNPREVVARVRAVLRRGAGPPQPPQRLSYGAISLDLDAHRATIAGAPLELTPSEFDLLALFMRNPGHAFTRLELIEQGLGYAYAGMERTVDSHIKNLRKKIERDPQAAPLIETVYGVGYRLRQE